VLAPLASDLISSAKTFVGGLYARAISLRHIWSMFRVRYHTVKRDGDCGSHRTPSQKLALHPFFQGLLLVNKIRPFLLNFFASSRCRLRDASRLWLVVLDSLGRVSGFDVWYTTACRKLLDPHQEHQHRMAERKVSRFRIILTNCAHSLALRVFHLLTIDFDRLVFSFLSPKFVFPVTCPCSDV
jgi:hypothetical protein